MAYYISLAKTLALKLNKDTIHFFFHEVHELQLQLRGACSSLNVFQRMCFE